MPVLRERVYLDSCVLNRLTDDLTQECIRLEATAILRVLDGVGAGIVEWVASEALTFELSRNPDPYRRSGSLALLSLASSFVHPGQGTRARAAELQANSLGSMDALHLALAEEARADVLLTVDDRFLRRTAFQRSICTLYVQNPVDWVRRREPWLIKR